MFPETFYYGEDEERIGALPAYMYSSYGDSPKNGNASFPDHARVRVSDLSLHTSQNFNYQAFMHECNVNRLIRDSDFNEIPTRGLEHIAHARYNKTKIETEGRPNHEYQLNKLSHMQRDVGHWNLFLTLTANTNLSPGLAPISWVIDNFYDREYKERENVFQNNIGLFCRIWYRVVNAVIVDWIFNGPEKPFGDVLSYFYRFENQSSGSIGNILHVHGGLVLRDKKTYPELLKLTSCRMNQILMDHDCSPEKLMNDGLFVTREGYDKVASVID